MRERNIFQNTTFHRFELENLKFTVHGSMILGNLTGSVGLLSSSVKWEIALLGFLDD